jgi:hypothetical protein
LVSDNSRVQSGYVQPAVRIECGAKSALDPHRDVFIRPYTAEDAPELNISVPGATASEPPRTFWDKIVIVHGLRRWHEIRGELRLIRRGADPTVCGNRRK